MVNLNELKYNAQQKIEQLVNRFDDQKVSYLQAGYNETLTRQDFINPFFKALGWDIDNENGYTESYREVIHEDRLKIGESNKAPDYSFRLIGGKRLFFVEAKKPSVIIKEAIEPAYQLRSYGWSAKLPISIITDFQEFAIYDCTKKPLLTDKASTARIKYLTYSDYLNDFDFIWNTFSKERVYQGGFDNFLENDKNKKGTTTLDGEFLQSLDGWRTHLAKSISKNNKHLDEDEINFAVQQTIDRLIFLRIAEDRSIEPYGNLKNCIKDGNLYQNLFGLFERADQKYNSGLFDFDKDKISNQLEIDNNTLKTIINELYFPSPYQFSVLPVEILGTAYEQFLGKQIKIDKAHKVTIEPTPAVRKAGGVYYTPQYIVDYIVKNTIGKLIEGKTVNEISKLKIVDPACGSGSFLLGAYEFLLNHHKDLYTKKGTIAKGAKSDTLTPEGNLTTAEKKRILLNNIYGVDIDVNAVEVTKLSLLIKCMEGETEASIANQMRLFHDRVLPTLDDNIKSGNSLIDTDYYDNELDFGDEKKIKPFNWGKSFPTVFKQGGFDVVIGNPPYVKEYTDREAFENIKKSHLRKYYKGKMDLWYFFVCYGIDILKSKGLLGFIAPNNWTTNAGASILRNKVINESKIASITDFGNYMIFSGASIQTMILILEKEKANNYPFNYCKIENIKPDISHVFSILNKEPNDGLNYLQPIIVLEKFIDKFLLFGNSTDQELLLKIQSKQNFFLNEKEEVAQGIVSPQDYLNKKGLKTLGNDYKLNEGIFCLSNEEKEKKCFNKNELSLIKPLYSTENFKKFYADNKNRNWIIYTDSKFKDPLNIKSYPKIKKHIDRFSEIITSDNSPYGLHRSRNEYFFKGEKIISVRKCSIPTFTYTNFDCYVSQTFYIIKSERIDQKYLTAILNSKLIAFWLKRKGKMQGAQYQIDKEPILQIPIFETEDKKIKEEIVKNVNLIMDLYQEETQSKLQTKTEQLKQRIEYSEQKINQLVYQLYDLTDEEIQIIEKSFKD